MYIKKHMSMHMASKRLNEVEMSWNCNIQVTQNGESASKNVAIRDMKGMLDQMDDDKPAEYTKWQRVEVDGKKKNKIIKLLSPKQNFQK